MLDTNFSTVDEGIEKLKKNVAIRDKMGGALYWNILNDECCAMAEDLASAGVSRPVLSEILGEGTFR